MFFELAEEEFFYNQTPVKSLVEDMKKLKDGFLRNGLFVRREEGEIEDNRFLRDSEELANFINKILDKHHDQTSI